MDRRDYCDCGVSVIYHPKWGFFTSLDEHKETEKHKLMLELKSADPESHALALNPSTEKVKCSCGQMVCRWTMPKHQQTKTHLKKTQARSSV